MTRRVFNYGGGMHSPAALTQLMRDALSGEVADGLDVVAGSGMNVTVNAGTALVGRDPSYNINVIGTETVNVGAASPSNPINAVIVAYVDRNVAGDRSVTDNTNDVFKLKAISGAAASNPADPTNSAIQAAIGASNPFIILARVKKRAGATAISSNDITDLRKMMTLPNGRINNANLISDGTIESKNIKDGSILPQKLSSIARGDYSTDEVDTGKKWIDGRPIFRKVVRGKVNFTGNSSSSIPHGITGLTRAWEIISYSGCMCLGGTLSNELGKQALPYIESTHQAGVSTITESNVNINGSYPWGWSEISIVVEYVK